MIRINNPDANMIIGYQPPELPSEIGDGEDTNRPDEAGDQGDQMPRSGEQDDQVVPPPEVEPVTPKKDRELKGSKTETEVFKSYVKHLTGTLDPWTSIGIT